MAEVIPISPVPQRDFAYSHSHQHSSLNVKDLSTKTRDIQLITNTGPRPSPTRIPSSLLKQDIPHSFSARLIKEEPANRWYDKHGKCGSLSTTDIPGAKSVFRHVAKRNKPEFTYSCRDIPGAVVNADRRSSERNGRPVDPLTPVYKLPQYQAGPPLTYFSGTQPLPHPRQTLSCADIEGAHPFSRFNGTAPRTSTFLLNDVQTRKIRPHIRSRRSPLDVSDIMEESKQASHAIRTNRMTYPLDPRYDWDKPPNWSEEQHGQWMVGDYHGEKPRPMMSAQCCPPRLEGKKMPPKPYIAGSSPQILHSMQLGTSSVPFGPTAGRTRTEVRHSNNIADIECSGADSAKAGLQTIRNINPLMPEYQWPSVPQGVGSDRYVRTPDLQIRSTVPPAVSAATPELVHTHSDVELQETLNKVKEVFHSRGAFAGRSMARLVRHFDNGDGQVNKDELKVGLEHFLGNDVAPDELEYLLNYFDTDHSGAISVDEFLHGIRGNLDGRRMHSVDMTFEHLDKHLDGYLTLNDIRAHYKADNHPKVAMGRQASAPCNLVFSGDQRGHYQARGTS